MTAPSLLDEHVIRLSPETYIRLDGTDQLILQNAYCDQALRIKFDILLIVYELIEWKNVGELLAPWPPGDQAKIRQYLQMFTQAQMLQIQGVNDQPGPSAPEPEADAAERLRRTYNKVPINVENHLNMLKDGIRMAAYRRAIERTVQPGDIVLDLGAGSGVLSFFASRAGATTVHAVERQPHIADLAEALGKANGIEGLTVHRLLSTQLQPDQLGPSLPTVLVSEILGDGILEENVVEYTLDARRRLLAPNARMIPQRLAIDCFAFQADLEKNDTPLEVAALNELYGLDFSLLGQVLGNKATLRRERYHPQLFQPVSDPVTLHTLDFRTLETPHFRQAIRVTARQDGAISGLCLYFKAWLDEETVLTNSPWSAQTHWSQLLYYLPQRLPVTTGQVFEAELIYDGALRVGVLG